MDCEKTLSLSDLVERFGCRDASAAVSRASVEEVLFCGVAPLSMPSKDCICFLANDRYVAEAENADAGAILCSEAMAEKLVGRARGRVLACNEPYVTFARVAQHFFEPVHPCLGHSPQAFVDATASIDPSATISPFVFVGPGAVIGARAVLYPGVFVGAGSEVGEDCLLYPNAVLREGVVLGQRCIVNPGAVLGGDGFGFAPSGLENVKIPQVGGLRLGNDVEVGSNASLDRGAMADTVVGDQTKIDSMVQIGHNVVIGRACFVCGLTGVAGSVQIGDRVTLAGQVGVSGHLTIGDRVTVTAQSGVSKSIPDGEVWGGSPARPHRENLLQLAAVARLAKSRGSKT